MELTETDYVQPGDEVVILDEDYDAELAQAMLSHLRITCPQLQWAIRQTQAGEAGGTYCRRADGTLQILGYGIPEPETITDAILAAWQIGLRHLDQQNR